MRHPSRFAQAAKRTAAEYLSLAAVLLAPAFLAASPVPSRAAVGVWQFDKAHSKPTFTVRHLFGMVPGHFDDFSGTIRLDDEKLENSSVEVTIQTASINTENQKRDAHLRSADFFDAAAYPVITFKSTKVEATGTADLYKVTGDLTIRDVTRPAVLMVQVLGMGPDPLRPGGKRGGFLATGTINRMDYGVKWNKTFDNGGTLVGDEVKIEFPVEAATVDS